MGSFLSRNENIRIWIIEDNSGDLLLLEETLLDLNSLIFQDLMLAAFLFSSLLILKIEYYFGLSNIHLQTLVSLFDPIGKHAFLICCKLFPLVCKSHVLLLKVSFFNSCFVGIN